MRCVRLCVKLNNRAHIYNELFADLNWLHADKRISQCINTNIFKYSDGKCPSYLNNVFEAEVKGSFNSSSRISYHKLAQPIHKTSNG